MYYSSIHCTRKGSAEALARPVFTEIDLPSLIAHVRAEELYLACLIVAVHRTEVSDKTWPLGSLDNPIAMDSDSGNKGTQRMHDCAER